MWIEWESWSEERERVGVRLLVVDTWWTKKDPFAAVLEGEGGDTALACLTSTLTRDCWRSEQTRQTIIGSV